MRGTTTGKGGTIKRQTPFECVIVFLVEDNDLVMRFISHSLERSKEIPCEIIVRAATIEQAMEAIPRLEELGVMMAIVDGNLRSMETSCLDGEQVVAAIRKKAKNVKVIGYSATPSEKFISSCDKFVHKTLASNAGKAILQAVKELIP